MRDLGIEFISVFGLPPVDFVHLAADLGCRYVSTALIGSPLKSLGYPSFSLRDDAQLRRELLAAMGDRGVSISLGEGLVIVPGADVVDLTRDLDVMAELGAARINTLSFDRDRNRTFDQLATLTQLAAQRGIGTTVELAPGATIGDPPTVLAAIEHVGSPDLRLTVDTMHWVRAGYGAAELREIGPEVIGHVQLSDTTLKPRMKSYMEEAMYERMAPGDGELPLAELLAAVPTDVVVGLEIPMRSLAASGVGPIERLRPCVAAARELCSN
ncbi:sugar phosphate isomerase/epimerase family protein [Mycobacterium sp.]|uniref:sugar phosphate isomerase/epimerase family protein n=1 Tax=Mycobacterium sp. TaxID=1785 RepID=UPI002CD42553|nr:TIM barrel protein [Mycobacterium sp.]HTQ17338.1 TIM barrel protein [Mycobacterium sp.]